jgi:DNA gyrase subunit A
MDDEVAIPAEDASSEVEVFANANTASNIELRTVENVMEDSYLRYSMSVIIERALPDVRDGLKPVHRRILYSMNSDGLRSSARHRKSANVVVQ